MQDSASLPVEARAAALGEVESLIKEVQVFHYAAGTKHD